jgi:molecular chaperone HscC
MIIGIDLGTTNSVAAYLADSGPTLIPNATGSFLTPSVVGVDENNRIIVGQAAKDYQVTHPDRCASVFKRYMGSVRDTKLGKHVFSPEKLSSLVLKSIKEDAEAYLKQPINEAVITVPAYFNDNQRKATIAAGQMAGFDVRRILNEPTAAALAYGMHDQSANRTLMIVDLGGGTFDVSIVEIFDGSIEVRATAGECFLGGEDFTMSIVANVLRQKGLSLEKEELISPKRVARLCQLCEQAKRKLSKEDVAEVRFPDAKGDINEHSEVISIAASQFQEWTANILQRIDLPIRRSLGDAKLNRSQIDEILLVGGATRMPAVVNRIREVFQKEPKSNLDPDLVVGLGASVQAGLFAQNSFVDDLVVSDVCPFTLGINISKQIADRDVPGFFMPIINRNTTIPVSRVDRVQTLHGNQIAIQVEVYQGESRMVKDNLKISAFEVTGLQLGPAGQEVDIRFTYDLNGVLEVEATIVKTGKKTSHVVTHFAKNLSPLEVRSAVKDMQGLKLHARDDAVNQAVLRRAERMFTELPAHERNVLNSMLDAFESAMEVKDEIAMNECRQVLDEFLNQFDQGY